MAFRSDRGEVLLKMTSPVKASPFGYFGAKNNLATKIIDILPVHSAWVEGFCGSAAITCLKEPSPIEVINDLDDEIINFFKQMRDNHKQLIQKVSLTPYAKKEWELAHEHVKGLQGVEKARRFLIRTMMTINGTLGKDSGFSFSDSYSRNGCEARVNRWINLTKRLDFVAQRLRRVRIENRDAINLIDQYSNRPATILYLDPPYLAQRMKGYCVEAFDPEYHKAVLDRCMLSKSMVLISGYDNPIYRERLNSKKGWKTILIKTNTRDVSGKDFPRTEVLWMNKSFAKAKKEGKIPIRFSKKEILNRKLNPER